MHLWSGKKHQARCVWGNHANDQTMKVILSIHHNFTLMVCCFSVSPCQQLMLEISVFYTHLQSEKRQMPKQNFVKSFFKSMTAFQNRSFSGDDSCSSECWSLCQWLTHPDIRTSLKMKNLSLSTSISYGQKWRQAEQVEQARQVCWLRF